MLYHSEMMMIKLVYLQRLGRCEECAGGNKPGKVNLKSKIHKILLNRS